MELVKLCSIKSIQGYTGMEFVELYSIKSIRGLNNLIYINPEYYALKARVQLNYYTYSLI